MKGKPDIRSLGRQRSLPTPEIKACTWELGILRNLSSTAEGGCGDLLVRVDGAGTSLHNRALRLSCDRGFPLSNLSNDCFGAYWIHRRVFKMLLTSERWPASSAVGAALATATSRRQLWGLKALHILITLTKSFVSSLKIVKMLNHVESCHQDSCNARRPKFFCRGTDMKVGGVRFEMSERHGSTQNQL